MDISQHIERLFEISTSEEFEELALETFKFQYENVPAYRQYADLIHRNQPKELAEIPFMPIDFFKFHEIRSRTRDVEEIFKSSGTTQKVRSVHYLENTQLYERSFLAAYEKFVGAPENQIIIALLPNYVEQKFSSLVYMVNFLIKKTNNSLSDFYLYQPENLKAVYQKAVEQGKQVVLFGVTYALLDLAEYGVELPGIKVIETGGMKGRRKEISKAELHTILKSKLKVETIYSEYGMCELLSQAYSEGLQFETPAWMKILVRDKNDPFSYVGNEKSGGINVIDLMNLFSCSFIQTQDLGKIHADGHFEILGRIDNAAIRGCNLMVDELNP